MQKLRPSCNWKIDLHTNHDCIECDMANDAWKHWKELVQYVCCLAALGPLKARVASRRRTHHPFEAGSAPTRQPLPERPLDYHDNVTTETVQRLTIAPSHDNLVKRVRINVLIAPIIDQEIGLLLKNWDILWNTETAEIQLQCKPTHTRASKWNQSHLQNHATDSHLIKPACYSVIE